MRSTALISAVLVLLSSCPALAAPTRRAKLPDTDAGRVATAFFKAFNSGDDDVMRAFESKYRAKSALKARSIDERIDLYHDLRADWQDLRVDGVFDSKPLELSLGVIADASDEFLRFRFELEPETPHGLKAVYIEQGGPRPSVAVAGQQQKPLTAQQRAKVIHAVANELERAYVLADVAARMASSLRMGFERGEYDGIDNPQMLSQRLTDDLRAICHDKHLAVRVADPGAGEEGDENGHRQDRWASSKAENFGFEKVERLPGNIGYLKFNEFSPFDEAKDAAAAAMAFIVDTDALIFDLRDNGGGSPEMIAFLSSYLFDKPTHLNSFYNRPEDSTTETWTQADVPGRRYGEKKPVFVLTGHYTFSGAEEFTYNLKNLKRGTIVGETTGGGAHPVYGQPIDGGFLLMVPYARAINPITKTNWEGVGVEPDISVPAGRALLVAQREALTRLTAGGEDAGSSDGKRGALRRVEAALKREASAAERD